MHGILDKKISDRERVENIKNLRTTPVLSEQINLFKHHSNFAVLFHDFKVRKQFASEKCMYELDRRARFIQQLSQLPK